MDQKIPNLATQAAMNEAREKTLPRSQLAPILALIPAQPADQEFIFNTFKAAMKGYVQWAWGWDEEAQRLGLLSKKNLASFQLITLHGEKIGALLLERSEEQHYLRTIFMLPQHHKRGIGNLVMQSLQRDAQAALKPLQLRVILTNPVQRLYARLGFKVIGQDEKTMLMRWQVSEQMLAQ